MKKVLVGGLLLVAAGAVAYYAYFHTGLVPRQLNEGQVAALVHLVAQKRTAEFRALQRASCSADARKKAEDPELLMKLENVALQEMIRQPNDGSYIITLSADHVPHGEPLVKLFKTSRRAMQIHGIAVEDKVSLLGFKYLDQTGDVVSAITTYAEFTTKYGC